MSEWTDKAVTKLQQLANEGYSASQVAMLMNRELGTDFTRNAIIGKLTRLGLDMKGDRRRSLHWTVKMHAALNVAMQEGLTLQASARVVSAASRRDVEPQQVQDKIDEIRARQERERAAAERAKAPKEAKPVRPISATVPRPEQPAVRAHVAPVVPIAEPPAPPAGDAVSLQALNDWHCRWPVGADEAGMTTYCGAPKRRGSYCAHHARMAYQPPPERKVKAPLPVHRTDKTFARFA